MALVPLTHCPDCGYDLRGLPARHRCPECGFEYDEHTRVWKPSRPWVALLGGMGGGVLLVVQVVQVFSAGALRGVARGEPLRVFCLVSLAAFVSVALPKSYRQI